MKKYAKRLLTLLLAGALLFSGSEAFAAEYTEYASVRVYVNGMLRARAYEKDGQIFLSAEELCDFLNIPVERDYDEQEKRLSLSAPGLALTSAGDQDYVIVNGRVLYNPNDFFVKKNQSYFPLELLMQVFGTTAYLSNQGRRLELDLSNAEMIRGGENYYDYYKETYGEETVFWLGRIIHAEAANQPLAGKIGVGNVVLNRVASDRYPNTVFDVVFDTNHGIQFQPVINKSIYRDASEYSVIAACLCLEGYNTVGDSLFFVAPAIAELDWVQTTRTFVVRIGVHDFYK